MKVLENIPSDKENLLTAILKTLVAQRNKERLHSLSPEADKEEQIKTFKYWKQL